jgi:hypothetical protein
MMWLGFPAHQEWKSILSDPSRKLLQLANYYELAFIDPL